MGGGRKAVGMAGFVVLGLSPSFVDWQQSPARRWQIVLFYIGGLALIYLGVFGMSSGPGSSSSAAADDDTPSSSVRLRP